MENCSTSMDRDVKIQKPINLIQVFNIFNEISNKTQQHFPFTTLHCCRCLVAKSCLTSL